MQTCRGGRQAGPVTTTRSGKTGPDSLDIAGDETQLESDRPTFIVRTTADGCHGRILGLPDLEVVASNRDDLVDAAQQAIGWALGVAPTTFDVVVDASDERRS
jgi:hypothetical protein